MTRRFLLDTDVISLYLKGHMPRLSDLIKKLGYGQLYTTSINVHELWRGLFKRKGSNTSPLALFLEGVIILPLSGYSARSAARITQDLRDHGKPVGSGGFPGEADCLIAAIALEHECTLVTRNEKHFRPIPNLPLEIW
ncbi:MAG: type II toxin-antitoxin system VapC family toxin [Acidobacteriota bacterium]|nr:type II toxin-antitoxin system VapC family toxin [Acidobacteriota bacterium]